MEVAGPLGTPLGLAQRKRASPHRRQPTRLPRPWDSPGTPKLCIFPGQAPGERRLANLFNPGLQFPAHCCPLSLSLQSTTTKAFIYGVEGLISVFFICFIAPRTVTPQYLLTYHSMGPRASLVVQTVKKLLANVGDPASILGSG